MIKDYLLNPGKYWADSHQRNVQKLKKFLASGRNGREVDEYVEQIIGLSKARTRFDGGHFYLVNAGSSGSHWLEAMLGLLPGFYNGGEIYIPKKLISYISNLPEFEASTAIDAIYLAHTGRICEDYLTATISNSAHLASHNKVSDLSRNKTTALLLRNPVDVVISRTFRKGEYRRDMAPDLGDKEYLEKNCLYVEKFYTSVNFRDFDCVVKYEEFLDSPAQELEKLAGVIGLSFESEDIVNAVSKTSKKTVIDSVSQGGKAMTNVYIGEEVEHDWAREYAYSRLEGVLKEYGYS